MLLIIAVPCDFCRPPVSLLTPRMIQRRGKNMSGCFFRFEFRFSKDRLISLGREIVVLI